MGLGWGCGMGTAAGKRYQRRVLIATAAYLVVLLGASRIVRHDDPRGWHLYFWSLLPAIPVIVMMAQMGRYLQEEKDEYMRALTVRSLLVGTAALLGTLVVNDFLRAFTPAAALAPFVSFVLFFVAFGIAQLVQSLQNRADADA